jgi:4'-phosphopantetheinyl transferase
LSLFIYTTEYPGELQPEQFRSLLERLPEVLQQKVLKYRRWQDAYGSLFGKLLLKIALEKAGSACHLDQLRYTAFNRPYLPQAPDFNISHSGNLVACIINTTGRVGIDVETISEVSFDNFENQFTPGEWMAIHRSSAPAVTFYQFWTAKESIIKADGRGLDIPLQQLDVCGDRRILLGQTCWAVCPVSLSDSYACHISVEMTSMASPCSGCPDETVFPSIYRFSQEEILGLTNQKY